MTSGTPAPVSDDEVQAFIDERLAPERRSAVEAWLARNGAVAERVATDRALRRHLRERLAPIAEEPIPDRLRIAKLVAARREPTTPARGAWLFRATAAALLLGLGAASGWFGHAALDGVRPRDSRPATQDAVAAFRTYVVEAVHPVEVKADQRPHLIQWLTKRVGEPVIVPDLAAQGFRLMGGRVVPTEDTPASLLMYDDAAGNRLTLYSRIGGRDRPTSFRFAQAGDVSAFSWVEGDLSYVVTARLDQARLLAVAEAIDAQVRPASDAPR